MMNGCIVMMHQEVELQILNQIFSHHKNCLQIRIKFWTKLSWWHQSVQWTDWQHHYRRRQNSKNSSSRTLKVIQRNNKFFISITLPKILNLNPRSIYNKIQNFKFIDMLAHLIIILYFTDWWTRLWWKHIWRCKEYYNRYSLLEKRY